MFDWAEVGRVSFGEAIGIRVVTKSMRGLITGALFTVEFKALLINGEKNVRISFQDRKYM